MITDKFSTFVNPDVPIPFDIEKLTSINDAMVLPYPKIDVILLPVSGICGRCSAGSPQCWFDVGFIGHYAEALGLPFFHQQCWIQYLWHGFFYQTEIVLSWIQWQRPKYFSGKPSPGVDDAGATTEILPLF